MRPVECDYPGGVIAIASGDMARYNAFPRSLLNLIVPENTLPDWQQGMNVAENFNISARTMLANPKFDWFWIMGDDHVVPEGVLMRLLGTMYQLDADVVCALCAYRKPPFAPVMFSGDGEKPGWYKLINWSQIPDGVDIMEPWAVGSAGMLVRRRVFEKIADPWFVCGIERPDAICEDITFCRKVRNAGFNIIVDLKAPIGHIGNVVMWPYRDEPTGKWGVTAEFSATAKFHWFTDAILEPIRKV